MNRATGWLLVAVLLTACGPGQAASDLAAVQAVAVQRGNLRITVTEGGDLDSGKPVAIRSEVEGRPSILGLIPEGTQVKKGDWLVKLDSSGLQDNLNRAEIRVEESRSQVEQALQALEIQAKRNSEDETSARTDVELAESGLIGYLKGTYELEKSKLESTITLAQERLARAKSEAEASRRLAEKSYVSKSELEADRLAERQAEEAVRIAELDIKQLENFTKPDEIKRLTADIEVKKLAYARVQQQAMSELKQKTDALEANKKSLTLETEARDKLAGQLSKTMIYAPSDGLVVYARQDRGGRMGGSEPIGLGKEVREQEEILRIPDLSSMMVKVDIHESAIKKVREKQRAWIRVDAIPNRLIPGTVTRVSLVPSSQSSWMNPDLKVYETFVQLEETVEGVKPGMHAQVEIIVQEIADAVHMPLQAAHQSGSRTFAYVKKGDGTPELREIKVGYNNQSYVHVESGLNEGEMVFLVPPPGAPNLPEPEAAPDLPSPAPTTGTPAGQGPGGGSGTSPTPDDGNLPRGAGDGNRSGRREGGGRPEGTRGEGEGRRAMSERMQNMSPEDRAKFMEEMRRRRGGTEGAPAAPPTPPTGQDGERK